MQYPLADVARLFRFESGVLIPGKGSHVLPFFFGAPGWAHSLGVGMSKKLFLYASREGQTRKICECMAEVCRIEGHDADVHALTEPKLSEILGRYDQVVIGASIHYGHFPQVLYRFIRENQQSLAVRSNAFFGVNLTARKSGKDTPHGSSYMRKFMRKSSWQPQKLAVFAGALLYSRYTWYDRMMIRFIMQITGGPTDVSRDVEFTDWARVRSTMQEWLKS